MSDLTKSEEKFAALIVSGKSQSDALRECFPHVRKWQDHSIWSKASTLASSEKVAKRIEELRAKYREQLGVTVERVLLERARLAFFDPAKLLDNTGRPKAISELDEDTRRAIAGLDVEDLFEGRGDMREKVGTVVKYKLADKNSSLTALEKHLGMYQEKENTEGALNIHIHL